MTEKNIWDSYGRWDDFARISSIDALKEKITGYHSNWHPNVLPSAIATAFQNLIQYPSDDQERVATVLDFGCGLGRNGPLLKSCFPRVIGYDLPEMIARVREHYGDSLHHLYHDLVSDLATLSDNKDVVALYDSVCLQHIVDPIYVANIVGQISRLPSLKLIVTVYNSAIGFPEHLRHLSSGWRIQHTEIESRSFDGINHTQTLLCRIAP